MIGTDWPMLSRCTLWTPLDSRLRGNDAGSCGKGVQHRQARFVSNS